MRFAAPSAAVVTLNSSNSRRRPPRCSKVCGCRAATTCLRARWVCLPGASARSGTTLLRLRSVAVRAALGVARGVAGARGGLGRHKRAVRARHGTALDDVSEVAVAVRCATLLARPWTGPPPRTAPVECLSRLPREALEEAFLKRRTIDYGEGQVWLSGVGVHSRTLERLAARDDATGAERRDSLTNALVVDGDDAHAATRGDAVRAARREGRARLRRVGRGGCRASGHARDQAGGARAAGAHRRMSVRVHLPRPLRRAARRTAPWTTTPRSSCSRRPPPATRAQAPTSSRRRT